jgi:vancomycin resistance protein YoaR
VVVLVLAAAYGVTYLLAGDKLARNATVAGIEIGGLTPAEARAVLERELPAVVDTPIRVQLGETEASYDIVPSEAGLVIDIPATVAAVPGGSANPVSLVQALLGGEEVTPRPDVDADALRASLEAIAEQSDTEPVNGAVGFEGGNVVTSDPVTGNALDVDAAAEVLSDAFFGASVPELPIADVTVPVDQVEPRVTQADVDRAVSEFAEPAMSGPVTVVAGGESVDLSPELIGQTLSMSSTEDGSLQPEIDGEKLVELASDELAQIGQEGKDATIRIENGSPVVVPAQRGKGVETDSLGDVVLLALTEEDNDRRAEVEMVEVDPELTTAAAEELGVKEVVAEFTTNFPAANYRDVNIGRAAELINNTFLRPGDEFSMNGVVGERTEANGFTAGTIINQGRLEDAMGGGVSQVATTTFHAAFQAGLEDVEHWPHSIYFDRYPIAQEATVAWGSKDLRFANDTPYGVVIETRFTPSAGRSQGSLTVRIWSTEYYRVETSVSERSNFTSPRTIYDTSSNCSAQGGSQGFSITSYRKVWTLDGELVKDEASPWTYNPNHRVVCGPDPDDD